MKESQILYFCQLLFHNDHLDDYTALRLQMSALIGPPGTGKTNTIMSLPAKTHWLLTDRVNSVVQEKQLRRGWMAESDRKVAKSVEHYHVTNTLRRVQIRQFYFLRAQTRLLTL